MLLTAFVLNVYLPSRISVCPDYARQLVAICERFSAFIGRPAKLADLNTAKIAKYLTAYRVKFSDRSTNNERQKLFMLWDYAFQSGSLRRAPNPKLIATLRVEQRPPRALTFAEICRVVEICQSLTGSICDLPASDFWTSLVLAEYWTACRIGAMIATPSTNYGDGCIEIGRQKGKKTKRYRLPPSCCHAIDRLHPHGRERIWPWTLHRTRIFPQFRAILEMAGLHPPKNGHHLFHAIRRTNISYCAAVDPALAQRQANHASYSTTLRYYVDESIANERQAADVLPDPIASQPQAWKYRIVG